MTKRKAVGLRQFAEGRIKLRFNIVGDSDIAHRAARLAQQMVVMANEVFCEFKTAELVIAQNTRHNAR